MANDWVYHSTGDPEHACVYHQAVVFCRSEQGKMAGADLTLGQEDGFTAAIKHRSCLRTWNPKLRLRAGVGQVIFQVVSTYPVGLHPVHAGHIYLISNGLQLPMVYSNVFFLSWFHPQDFHQRFRLTNGGSLSLNLAVHRQLHLPGRAKSHQTIVALGGPTSDGT